MSDYSDKELIRLFLEGNQLAYSVLMQRYKNLIMHIGFKYVKNIQAAEDILQDVLIKVFTKLSSFEGRSSFKSWVCTITTNTSKNFIRNRKPIVDIENVVIAIDPVCESNLIKKRRHSLLESLVEALPDKQQAAIRLRLFEDLSFKEVADLMGCPYDTAKANYRHAMLKIKQRLKIKKKVWQGEVCT